MPAETEVIEAVDVLPDRVLNPPKANMTRGQKKEEQAHSNIARIEDDLFAKSFRVINEVLDFRDVDIENPEASIEKWVDGGMDPDEAKKRLQLALAGWNKAADMPGGVKLAQETFIGITKARSNQPAQHVHFHAEFKEMPVPQVYPEMIEESD